MRAPVLAVTVTSALALVAAGVCLAAALTPVAPPSVLTAASPGTSAPATPSTFDDARKVKVSFVSGDPTSVTTPIGGVLTRRACAAGGSLESGTVVAHVDERPLLGLATDVPLYRDLQLDDEGADVRALQAELSRLGHPVGSDGRLGPRTARAVTGMLRDVDVAVPAAPVVLALDQVVRLPRASTPLSGCADLGSSLAPGDELAAAPAAVTAVRLSSLPNDLAPGERDLTLLGATGPMTDDATTDDAGLVTALARTDGFDELVLAGGDDVPATLLLREPVTVLQVPAASVTTSGRGGAACLALRGRSVPVEVMGSTLGASLVRLPDDVEPPTEVSLRADDRRASCR